MASNEGLESLARATTLSTTSRKLSQESNKCAQNWACNMRQRRMLAGYMSICLADQRRCHRKVNNSMAEDTMDNSLKVVTNKADILASRTMVNNSNTATNRMARMTRWRSWLGNCCRNCSRSWMDAVLSCKRFWVRYIGNLDQGANGHHIDHTLRFIMEQFVVGFVYHGSRFGYLPGSRVSQNRLALMA